MQDVRTNRLAATGVNSGRRWALKAAVSASALALAPISMAATLIEQSKRSLALVNKHTGESLELTYFHDGAYVPEALTRFDELMRDHRAEERCPISTKLLDLLYDLRARVGAEEPVHVLSGYRSPKTNELLRKRKTGVARRSYHMIGEAADVYLPDVDVRALHAQAVKLKAGGVGYYPRSGFIHVDVGPVRAWRG